MTKQEYLIGDCLELLPTIEDKSVDLIIADPPYNINKADWDNIPDYLNWSMGWIKECQRVLKDNGSMYIFHSEMPTIARLMIGIENETDLIYKSMITWEKYQGNKQYFGRNVIMGVNADRKQNSLCGDNGQIVIDSCEGIGYVYPSPGTYYHGCHVVDPEDLLNVETIESNYNLDIVGFQTDARDAVIDENEKKEDDEFTDIENNTVSEYVNQYISEWKEWARLDKKDVLSIEDAEGNIVDTYKIEWR